MGDKNTTVQNLEIEKIDLEDNVLLVKGAVPGSIGSFLKITPSIKSDEKLTLEASVEEASAEEVPVENESVEGAAVNETAVNETPVEEAPVEDTAVEETVKEEAKTEELEPQDTKEEKEEGKE